MVVVLVNDTNPELNLYLRLFQVPFIIWNPALNEDRQEGDEEICGWSDRKLLHLSSPSPLECLTKLTIHPQTPAPHWVSERGALWGSQEWRRSSLKACGSKVRPSCFYEGGFVGRVAMGLGPGGGRVKTNPYIHPVLEQATASHVLKSDKSRDTWRTKGKDKKGQINNSKTETVLINSIEWQGRVWRHTLISAVHWRTHFSGWFVTQLDGDSLVETHFCLISLMYLGNKGSEKFPCFSFINKWVNSQQHVHIQPDFRERKRGT